MSRIKLGVRSWSFRMYLPDGGMTIERFIRTAAEMGLEGVEILARHFPDGEEETAKRYARYARQLGVSLEAFALENDFAFPDAAVRRGEVENTFRWIRLAAASGVPYIKLFTGDTDTSTAYEEQRGWVKDCLEQTARYAQAYGVTVLVENHSPICFEYPQLRALVLEVDHPALRICPDTYNFSKYRAEPVVYEAARALIPLSPYGHLQFYEMDETGRELHMDMEKLLKIYDEMDYDGFLMLEWEGNSDPIPATAQQAKYVRSILERF